MAFKKRSKIEREKMNYAKSLFILCTSIDKAVMAIRNFDIAGLRTLERGILTLEMRLKPYIKYDQAYDVSKAAEDALAAARKEDGQDEAEEIEIARGKAKKERGRTLTDLRTGIESHPPLTAWGRRFELIMAKYGVLHEIMDSENLLLKEDEELET